MWGDYQYFGTFYFGTIYFGAEGAVISTLDNNQRISLGNIRIGL